MPICDCGFPPFVPVTTPDGNMGFETGPVAMLRKGPTILVEVGFETTLFADPTQAPTIATAMATGATQACIQARGSVSGYGRRR